MTDADAMEVDQVSLHNLSVWFLAGLSKGSGRLHLRQIDFKTLTLDTLKLLIIEEEKKRTADQESVLHNFDLLYNGNLLRNSEDSLNLKPDAVIHAVKKSHAGEASGFTQHKEQVGPEHLQQVSTALTTAFLSPTFLKTIEKLTDPEMLQNLFAIAPNLETDMIGIAILQTPQLILQLTNSDNLQHLANSRPWVIEALNYIAASVHEDKGSKPTHVPGNVMLSQLLNSALGNGGEDDEDMEEEDEPQPSRTHSQPNLRPITREQLAQALNAVPTLGGRGATIPAGSFMNLFNSAGASRPTTAPPVSRSGNQDTGPNFQQLLQSALSTLGPPDRTPNSAGEIVPGTQPHTNLAGTGNQAQGSGAPVLTGELVGRAMQEAFSQLSPDERARQFEQFRQLAQQVVAGNSDVVGSGAAARAPSTSNATTAGEYQLQLLQMRERGITDERLSILALRVCEGDVGTATDLILSGWDGAGADDASGA